MTTRKLASTTAAVSLAGAALLGMSAAPALAQEYPPASGGGDAAISDTTAFAGQSLTATTGPDFCAPGAAVLVEVTGTDIVAEGTAEDDGSATFTFDASSEPGDYEVIFTCEDGNEVSIAFTVSAAATGGTGTGTGTGGGVALPRTGSDSIVPLTLTGLGLVGVGGGIVVAARRRRQDMPGGLA